MVNRELGVDDGEHGQSQDNVPVQLLTALIEGRGGGGAIERAGIADLLVPSPGHQALIAQW